MQISGKKSQAVEYSSVFIPPKHDCLITVIGVRRKPKSATSDQLLTPRPILIISGHVVYQQDLIHH